MNKIRWTSFAAALLGVVAIIQGRAGEFEMGVILALVAIAWAVLSLNER